VENEFILRNFIVFAIVAPKIVIVGENLTKL